MKIDIGGGMLPKAGYINIDPRHGETEAYRVRVQDGLPFASNSVDAAYSSHVFEHIPSGEERVKAMNEVFRVLKPGATFEMIVPLIGFNSPTGYQMVSGWMAWADPTHVSQWVFPESLLYFCEGPFKPHADYGISIWEELRDDEWWVESGWEGHAILRKPSV